MYANPISHRWALAWGIWTIITFGSFLSMELYALATNWRNTLSNAVWTLEDFVPHQHIGQWSWDHALFAGFYLVVFIWLFFHFYLGWWRS